MLYTGYILDIPEFCSLISAGVIGFDTKGDQELYSSIKEIVDLSVKCEKEGTDMLDELKPLLGDVLQYDDYKSKFVKLFTNANIYCKGMDPFLMLLDGHGDSWHMFFGAEMIEDESCGFNSVYIKQPLPEQLTKLLGDGSVLEY